MTKARGWTSGSALNVAVLGYGAIGASVSNSLAAGAVEGARLAGVITRTGAGTHPHQGLSLDDALTVSDIVVECAGTAAVTEHGPRIIASGTDLFVASIGALADADVRARLLQGPGALYLTTGAIGGLDILSAAAFGGGLDSIELTTTKKARTLVQPWMDAAQAEALRGSDEPTTVFSGGVEDAIRLFPKSLNVAVALAVATGEWERTRVTMIADPNAELTTHEIAARGSAGSYGFTVSNLPHESNPATSKVVPAALLRGLAKLARPSGTFL
ncbi:aspartate dehydrogenase domain-containing protein [Cryobacterium sp. BB307]|uniref:aspartate dehydrogenase domain-containing protein n=1 Tax=Cryobacterium sp. BB307 TaxID=2716317 RepID=UPI0014475C66